MKIKELDDLGKPYRVYAENVDQGTMDQFVAAMKLDTVVKGALMPDAHLGYSLPIGGVVATDGVIYPSFVGYDIGCGVLALPLVVDTDAIRSEALAILQAIYETVPVGFKSNEKPSKWVNSVHCAGLPLSEDGERISEEKNWQRALGSLGSGNHFIEIGADEEDRTWLIIHSGSRGVGHGLASHYMARAADSDKPKEGHYGLDVSSQLGKDYITDLTWALHFALANRRAMSYEVVAAIGGVLGCEVGVGNLINRNHNHATLKDGLWIHRKGATHAEMGMPGVIPGNREDGSFIVEGKGNPDSLYSSSHGAGRTMSRGQAKRTLDPEEERKHLVQSGVVADPERGLLDESKRAYKNIYEVMEQQADLVKVVAHIKPLINVKG